MSAIQENLPPVQVIADPAKGPGECCLATRASEVDLGVKGQLVEIERGFADLLAQRPGLAMGGDAR